MILYREKNPECPSSLMVLKEWSAENLDQSHMVGGERVLKMEISISKSDMLSL